MITDGIGLRSVLLPLLSGRDTVRAVLTVLQLGHREKQFTDIGWKNKERQKIGVKMRIITCFGDRTKSD